MGNDTTELVISTVSKILELQIKVSKILEIFILLKNKHYDLIKI
jgi:hypothetical protein